LRSNRPGSVTLSILVVELRGDLINDIGNVREVEGRRSSPNGTLIQSSSFWLRNIGSRREAEEQQKSKPTAARIQFHRLPWDRERQNFDRSRQKAALS
jgi:hypothetical protein